MAVIGVYDYDFFHYEHVIPNLECAKIIQYNRNHNNITSLIPRIDTVHYSKTYIRKDYDDGIFSKRFFEPTVEYGGRAFTPQVYKPLDEDIELTVPDMHVYDKYISKFGPLKKDQTLIARLLRAGHVRLAPDGKNIAPMSYLMRCIDGKSGIVCHDYDLGAVPDALDVLKDISESRTFKTHTGINPYPIGNKFPIKVSNVDDLHRWQELTLLPQAFLFDYCGVMPDEEIYRIAQDKNRFSKQFRFRIGGARFDENQILIDILPKIYLQALFLQIHGLKISLIIDNENAVCDELRNLIHLLNIQFNLTYYEGFISKTQTLYGMVRRNKTMHYTNWAYRNIEVTTQEAREVFQYVRERNYDLFKMFYETDAAEYIGGKIVDVTR